MIASASRAVAAVTTASSAAQAVSSSGSFGAVEPHTSAMRPATSRTRSSAERTSRSSLRVWPPSHSSTSRKILVLKIRSRDLRRSSERARRNWAKSPWGSMTIWQNWVRVSPSRSPTNCPASSGRVVTPCQEPPTSSETTTF